MKPLLRTKLNVIVNGLKSSGEIVNVRTSADNDCFIIASGRLNKAVMIGISLDTLIAFKMNVKKWLWAEAEGFDIDEMVDNFASEIFEKMNPDEVIDYMLEK